jgi:cytosine/adenosine deaminase-related metal-dependent hydrolase
MVTAGAADAINRSDLGSLTPGSHADMVALDGSAPALNPVLPNEDDPISRVVWSGSPSAISGVWVAGRKVVENQRVTTIDAAALTGEMARRAERLADPKR